MVASERLSLLLIVTACRSSCAHLGGGRKLSACLALVLCSQL
jgi:hypothetical protein